MHVLRHAKPLRDGSVTSSQTESIPTERAGQTHIVLAVCNGMVCPRKLRMAFITPMRGELPCARKENRQSRDD
jgi:hypothetical protein